MGSVNLQHGEAFSIATLFYMRLRRVNSRVIDVMYFIENKEYASYIIEIAEKTNDEELFKYIDKLKDLLGLRVIDESEVAEEEAENASAKASPTPWAEEDKISEEEIYKAQVSHHYIGALR